MASIINALSSGTGGIVTSGDASGILQLQTSNTAAVTIDGSQNVGIGTASPGSGIRLDVLGGEIKAGRIDSSSEGGQVSFGRASDNATAWYIDAYGNTSTPSLRFVDVGAGAVSMGINSSGAVALRGAVSASGVGITFPATQSASSDANTLDDYEEGTWTPSIDAYNSAPTISYSLRVGYYVKVGQMVYLTARINVSSVSGGSGQIIIRGMPFSLNTNTQEFATISIGYQTGITTAGPTYGRWSTGNAYMELYYFSNPTTEATIPIGNITSSSQIIFSLVFQASA
jgi:hypothetical protein